jgi:hypothetical protein
MVGDQTSAIADGFTDYGNVKGDLYIGVGRYSCRSVGGIGADYRRRNVLR